MAEVVGLGGNCLSRPSICTSSGAWVTLLSVLAGADERTMRGTLLDFRVSGNVPRLHVPLAGLGVALLGLLALTVVAASTSGSPLPPGRPESSDLPGVVFLAAAGGAFALYVLSIVVIRRRRPSLAVVCGVAAAIQLIPLAGPLLLSRDVYGYWAYGRLITAHDANPY